MTPDQRTAADEGRVAPFRIGELARRVGATPRTEWLQGTVARDEQGFIFSGIDLRCEPRLRPNWPLDREPYPLETSAPGVFVAGDVRKGSVKRLAAAVGEGAMAVQFIHKYCKGG